MLAQQTESTYVFLILGEEANKKSDDSIDDLSDETQIYSSDDTQSDSSDDTQSECIKYCNYVIYSNSIVISQLALLRGIQPDHIFIFAYGHSSGYDMSRIPTNKLFFQSTIDEIYAQTGEPTFAIKFQYFTRVDEIEKSLSHFHSDSAPKNFLVFMEDHGHYEEFGQNNFYEFYRLFLSLKPKSLNIFADCCHGGYFLNICNAFNSLKPHFTILNEDQSNSILDQFQNIFEIYQSLSKHILGGNLKSTFQALLTFFDEQQSISTEKQIELNFAITHLYKRLCKKYKIKHSNPNKSIFPCKVSKLKSARVSENLRTIIDHFFPTIGDLYDIGVFLSKGSMARQSYARIFNLLKSSLSILITVQEQLQMNNVTLVSLLQKLLNKDLFVISDFQYPIPSEFSVCTTSHPEASATTFGTRRITDKVKIIMGSPGMSAFIHEIFLSVHEDGVSLERLKMLAQGTGPQIMQYAVKSGQNDKLWLSLDFRSIGACHSLPFPQLDKQDDQHLSASAQQILSSIGFSLVVKFKDDHETPDDENFPHKPRYMENDKDYQKRLQNYCETNYGFQISPKRDKRKRYQISDNFPYQGSSSEKDQFYLDQLTDSDEYYSDDAFNHSNQGMKVNRKKAGNKALSKYDWNQEIPQSQLDSFQFSFNPRYDYYFFLRDVFFTVFQTIKSDDYVINKSILKFTNISLEDDIYKWIKCFISDSMIMHYATFFIRPITSYIVNSDASLAQIQKWFFISFNIADQIVTPHYLKQKTFIKNRLNNPISLPTISSKGPFSEGM